ncbi:MAG: HlyD family efflux transporter periplasmic adaptor subunit [Lachnospiraceae bacterium]|nr:HlyD family efflux transporter periplasmic adaptor subunit [Lachnospiraceae bacterium]
MKILRKHKKLFIFLCIVAVLVIFLIVKMVSIQRQRSYAYVQTFSDLKMSGDDFSDTLDGTVTNENAQSITLDPEKTVGQVYVKAGDTVKKGDRLFSYNADDLTSQLNAQNEVISSSTAQLDIQNKLLAYYKGLKPVKEDTNTDIDDQDETTQSEGDDTIPSDESEVVNPNTVTEEEKAELIKSTTEDINNLQQSINSAKIDLQSLQQQIDDCTVKALVDGKIASIHDAETSVSSGTPFITISSETGTAVRGYVDEFTKNKIKTGDQIKVTNYMNDSNSKATVTYISDFPSTDENTPQYSSINNVSYYEFDAYLKDGNGFNPDDGVSISRISSKKTSALSRGYVRKDKKGSYCLVSRKGRLEKVYVETQKTMDPGTILIVSGLKNSDLIAFPYSKTGYVGNKTTRKSQRSIVERILY